MRLDETVLSSCLDVNCVVVDKHFVARSPPVPMFVANLN